MIQTKIVLMNKLGLHARASAKLVSTALRFQSQCHLIQLPKKINAKSIMAVMGMGARCGEEIELAIEGPDAQEMEAALVKLIENKFGESE